MPKIELTKQVREDAARALSRYLKAHPDLDVTGFDAVLLLHFATAHLAPPFYNQALADAQALLGKMMDEMGEAIWQLEQTPSKIR